MRSFLLPLVVTFFAAAGPAFAQQWPTADPSYSAADPALASGPEGFGAPGQIVVSSDFDFDLVYSKESGADSGATRVQIAPALMFFLARNLAVGGVLDFAHVSRESSSTTSLGVGPMVGYNLPLGPRLSLFPTAGLLYNWSKTSTDVAGGQNSSSGTEVTVIVRAPLLFHPVPHVFVGIAPFVSFDVSSQRDDVDGSKTRNFGLTLDLGFWL